MIYKVALTCVCKYRGGCLQALILANVLPTSLGIHTEQVFHSWSTGDFCLMELNLSLLRYWALRVSTIGRGDIEPSQETASNETIGSMSPNPSSSHFISSHFIYVHLSSSRVITFQFVSFQLISPHLASSRLISSHLSVIPVHEWQHHGSEHSGREKRRWEQKINAGAGNTNPGTGTPTEFWKKNYPQEGKAPLWEQKTPLPSEVL